MRKIWCKSCSKWREVLTGKEMIAIRKSNGLTLREMHEETGFSISFIADCEHDRRNPPEKLCNSYMYGDYND